MIHIGNEYEGENQVLSTQRDGYCIANSLLLLYMYHNILMNEKGESTHPVSTIA